MNYIFAFVSAARPQFSDEVNAGRHENLGQQLMARGFAIAEVQGRYDGMAERTWMVDLRGAAPPMMYVMDLAKRYGQESVLVVDTTCHGWLHYAPPAPPEHLGEFRTAGRPPDELLACTIMPNGEVFVCGHEELVE
jgi:hypothetical protein